MALNKQAIGCPQEGQLNETSLLWLGIFPSSTTVFGPFPQDDISLKILLHMHLFQVLISKESS